MATSLYETLQSYRGNKFFGKKKKFIFLGNYFKYKNLNIEINSKMFQS